MKKFLLIIFMVSGILVLHLKQAHATTYYWYGNGGTSDWKLPKNWTTTLFGYTNAGNSYPGANVADIAIFDYDYWLSGSNIQSPSIGAYNITVASVSVTAGITGTSIVNLAVTSGYTLTTTTFTTTNNLYQTPYSSLTISGTTSGTTPSFTVNGSTTLNYATTFTANTYGNINFPSGSSVTILNSLLGFAGFGTYYPAELAITGGSVVANGSAISYATAGNYGGFIDMTSGTFSVTGGSITMAGDFSTVPLTIAGGTFTNTSCPIKMSGVSPEIETTGGVSTITTSVITMNGTKGPQIYHHGGTINYYGSTVNVSGTYNSAATVFGLKIDAGTVNFGNTTAINASTLNLGTSSSVGQNAELSSTGGYFNLGAASVINILSTTTASGYNIYNDNPSVFTCASTSFINPTATTSYIYNVPGTGANTNSAYFTLLSDANGSATFGPLPTTGSPVIKGQYNVQRYISAVSRNYRLLSSPVNVNGSLPGSTNNVVNLYALEKSATVASATGTTTYNGAFVGGPSTGTGFTAAANNPCVYLWQESIVPTTSSYNKTFTSGKNVGVVSISATTPGSTTTPGSYFVHTLSTANASGGSGALAVDNSTNGTVVVPAGNGYLLYYIHDNTSLLTTSALNACTTTASGFINQGTIPLYMWGTNGAETSLLTNNGVSPIVNPVAFAGLTMVGNPYPSSIDLQQVYRDNRGAIFTAGTPGYFNELIPASGQFATYGYDGTTVYTSGTSPSQYVASGQGFYVTVVNANKTLTFYEDQKTTYPSTIVSESIPVTNPAKIVDNVTPTNSTSDASVASHAAGLHLKLVQDSSIYDECGLYFNNGWTDNFDQHDAIDMDGTGGQVFLSSYSADNVRTSINALGNYTGGKRVKLYVKFSTSGIYQLQMSDITNFNTSDYNVFLVDNMLKDSLDLTLYKSYNFNYSPGTANDSTRFVLTIEHKPVPYYALLKFAGQKVSQGVQLNWTVKNELNTTRFVVQKLVANNAYAFLDSLSSDNSSQYSYVDQHPSLGDNTYRLQQTNALGVMTYSAPVTIGYNSTSPNSGLTIYPNPAKTQITVTLSTSSLSTQVATAEIYNTSGKLIEHFSANSNSFTHDVSSYQLGVYIFELKNSDGLLVGKSKFVKVQ